VAHRLGVAQARLKAQGDLGALSLAGRSRAPVRADPLPDQPIAAMKARVWVRQGQISAALIWVREQGLSPGDELSYLREFEHLTLARVLIARCRNDPGGGSLREAVQLLDRLLRAAEAGGRTGSVIETLMLQALAHQAQGDGPAAITSLERALTLAEPEGYVQLFVAEGEPMRLLIVDYRLLGEKQKRGDSQKMIAYADKLLAAFSQPAARHRQSALGDRQSAWVEPLSERELEVLKLLGTELSGPEIARELTVSLNTVRTHTKNIYSKLGVNNRRAAVRRAEDLNLL
jgi:LuxR family maltose regulon positive regulatory protein